MQHVLLVYNTDYCEELKASSGADESAVQQAATAVLAGARQAGYDSQLVGIHGHDVGELIAQLQKSPPDLVFNICESLNGEARNEQVLPALLDLFEIPYTGPTTLTIGVCLHKDICKHILVGHGIPTPEYVVFEDEASFDDPALQRRLQALQYPFFVKLTREDASIGIGPDNVVHDPEELVQRARQLFAKYNQPVIAERYIDGREVNVTLLGNDPNIEALPLHEIDFAKMPEGRPHIISYDAKWDEDHVEYAGTKPVPMSNLTATLDERIRSTAIAAFRALGLRDFGRVDIRLDDNEQPWVIDVNPNCDLSPDAGVARAASAAGLDYPALVQRICELAWRRHDRNNSQAGTG